MGMLQGARDIAPANLTRHIDTILTFSNVPRKPKPFKNFVKNSCNLYNDKTIDEIWKIISDLAAKKRDEEAKAKTAAKPPPVATGGGTTKRKRDEVKDFDWAAAIEDVLSGALKQKMKWPKLADALVERFKEAEPDKASTMDSEVLQWTALAAVPDNYTSKTDCYICKVDSDSE